MGLLDGLSESSLFSGLAIVWGISAIIAAWIGSTKGEAGLSCLMGLVFGPLGILMAILSSGKRARCPQCQEWIFRDAKVCPFCQLKSPAFQKGPSNVIQNVFLFAIFGMVIYIIYTIYY